MGIQNFPAALQPIIQQGFLEREFETALKSRLGYRLVADREEFAVGIGETLTKTRAGLKPSITTPLAAATNTNLDNGLTPGNWGVEQYTISLNFYAATQDLNMVTSRVGIASQFTISAPMIDIESLPREQILGDAIAVNGTVSPAGNAVQIGLSASATVAPAVWVNAVLNDGAWTGSLMPAAAGTVYVWAQQAADAAVNAVSGAISVVSASLNITAPSTGVAAVALTVSGTVSPTADAVNVQLATQNSAAPTSGWTAAANSGGSFSAVLTPAVSGTYYVWAQDATTGVSAVSAAITVAAVPALTYGFNNPGGSYVHGVSTIPLNGAISPAQNVATQVALSTSNTVVPAVGWEAATIIYSNSLWAVYYATPASAGNYYVWVQTATGTDSAVSSFTVPVT